MNGDNRMPDIASGAAHATGPAGAGLEGTDTGPKDCLEAQLIEIWEEALDIPGVGVKDNFFELANGRYQDHRLIDHVSFRAVTICSSILAKTGKALPVATLIQSPTIEELAAILRQEDPSLPWSSLVAVQPDGSRPPFFLIHGAGAHVNFTYYLAHRLGPDQPFYGLQSRGLDGKYPPDTSIERMAEHYLSDIRNVDPEGPYLVGGRSLGGLVAFEMAQQLYRQGQEVALLALFDTYRPGSQRIYRDSRSIRERSRFDFHVNNLRRAGRQRMLGYALERVKSVARRQQIKLHKRTLAAANSFYQGLGRPLPRRLQDVNMANHRAFNAYVPHVYPGEATLFRARSQPKSLEGVPDLGWRDLVAGGLTVIDVPGEHATMYYEPHVDALADHLSACLAKCRPRHERGQSRDASAL